MSSLLWKQIESLAGAWRAEEDVRRVLAQMPSRHRSPRTGLPERIEMMQAGGGRSGPLRVAYFYHLMSQSPFLAGAEAPPGLAEWLSDATKVATTYRLQLGWMRAQLPGFPMLRVPQLVDGAPLVSSDQIHHIPWARQDFAAGYQLMSAPPRVAGSGRELGEAAARVAEAFTHEEEWRQFEGAQAALTASDIDQLRRVNTSLRHEVRSEAVDQFEPGNLIRRLEFRHDKLEGALDSLTGDAANYARSFDVLNDILQTTLETSLDYLVEFDRPSVLSAVDEIDLDGDHAEFSVSELVHVGGLVFVPDAAIDEAGIVESTSLTMDHGETRIRVGIKVLRGAREGLDL